MRVPRPVLWATPHFVLLLAVFFWRGDGPPQGQPGMGRSAPEPAERVAELVFLRINAKEQLAADVIAGRRSLREAATLFAELNRLPPAVVREPQENLWNPFLSVPADTEAGRLCRQVILWVRAALRSERDERERAVVHLLEEEYWAARDERGQLRLPDPSSLESVWELIEQCRNRPRATIPNRSSTPRDEE